MLPFFLNQNIVLKDLTHVINRESLNNLVAYHILAQIFVSPLYDQILRLRYFEPIYIFPMSPNLSRMYLYYLRTKISKQRQNYISLGNRKML